MMDNPFNSVLPGGDRPFLHICIFPHLREFLAIDLRGASPQLNLLNTSDVFDQDFFEGAEIGFSRVIREESQFPFAQLINLPLRLEEIIREVAMSSILDRLGIYPDGDDLPTMVVYILSGGALAMHSDQVIDGLKKLIGEEFGEPSLGEWEEVIARLVAEENVALQHLNRRELTEALSEDSLDYFTLWESRN
jgi:hypothetical protein